jgi:hypothetical protein
MVAQRPGPDKSRHVPLRSRALSDPGDPDNAAGRPYGGLLAGIEAVVSEMRARGLSVHVELTGDTPLRGERLARLLVAAAWLVPRARAGGFTRAEAAAAIADAVAAVVTIGWDRGTHGAGGSVDWSVAGTGCLLALVALSRPAWEWVLGALLVFAAHTILTIHLFGVSPLSLARLASTAYVLSAVLLVFAALRPTWRTQAGMAARRALLGSRSAAERAAAAAVQEDRQRRLEVRTCRPGSTH